MLVTRNKIGDMMKLFQMNEARELIQKERMYETFEVNLSEKQVIAVVGAGGKTTSMSHLAKELVSLGKRVVITTTTHMFLPTECEVLVEDKDQVLAMLDAKGLAVVGTPCEGEKMTKVSDAFFEWLRTISDYVLVEADGSKRLPIKVPEKHEPVLPVDTDLMIVVAGLSCLDRSLQECCHRWKLAMEILNCQETSRITPADVAKLLSEGYCTKYSIPYKILLNQCESKKAQNAMLEIMNELNENHIAFENVVFSSFLLG